MDIERETLALVADTLAVATGFVSDTAPPSGTEAQVAVATIINGVADRLGGGGADFLRQYARACEREDANPLVLVAALPEYCTGCGRESFACSVDPCLDVIEDRNS